MPLEPIRKVGWAFRMEEFLGEKNAGSRYDCNGLGNKGRNFTAAA